MTEGAPPREGAIQQTDESGSAVDWGRHVDDAEYGGTPATFSR